MKKNSVCHPQMNFSAPNSIYNSDSILCINLKSITFIDIVIYCNIIFGNLIKFLHITKRLCLIPKIIVAMLLSFNVQERN